MKSALKTCCLLYTLGAISGLGGCASYAPSPLTSNLAVLSDTTASEIATGAGRAHLSPVTIDLAQPLNANAVATVAVIANPDLKALRAQAKVADAQAFAAGLLPDPTFSIGVDNLISGPDSLDNLTAALGLDLNSLRTRSVTLVNAQSQARQVRLDLAWSEWQTSGQARLQAVRIQALQQQLIINRQSLDAQTTLLKRMEQATGSGDVSAEGLQTARAAAATATDIYNTNARSLEAARFELRRLLGVAPQTDIALAPTPLPPVPLTAERLFQIALDHRADLAALREGYNVQDSHLHLAVLQQFPTLNLTLNANRDTSANRTFGPAVDFTLPLWNRNRGGIAVETATREALRAEYDARLFQTRAEITAAAADIRLLRAQRDRLLSDMPATRAFVDASVKAAADGEISQPVAEATMQVLRDKESQLGQAEQEIAELTISLELLTGQPQQEWTQ